MTEKIIRCRDCKHWTIDKYYTNDNAKYNGYSPINEETGKMKDYVCGVCKMNTDMVEIDITCPAYGGYDKVTVETNNNFFCAAAEEK